MHRLVRVSSLCALVGFAACGAPPKMPAAAQPNEIRYEVAIEESEVSTIELAIVATFPPGTASELSVTEGAEPFVGNVEVSTSDESWNARSVLRGSWFAEECANGCRVRYRFALERAGDEEDEDGVAMETHGVLESPPPAWLLHPLRVFSDIPVYIHVVSHVKGVTMATGVREVAHAKDTYRLTAGELPIAPYTVFGKFRRQDVDVGASAKIHFAIASGKLTASDADLDAWASRAGHAVSDFYGRFPIPGTLVVALPSRGDDVGFGRTMAGGGASILINVGRTTDKQALDGDWVAVHEMIHLAFPSMGREHAWIEEGLATYLEPLVRVHAGMTTEKNVWLEFMTMLQNGLPRPGDRGLERTPTWGRVYWGGALFCLLADLEIRERTQNSKSLDDAVRGILAAGGDDTARWTMEYAFDKGDEATGVPVLRELYQKLGFASVDVDLDAIWKKLGLSLQGRDVVFDDSAPEAAIRKSMTARR
ncbi:MAG: hypothetical protein ACRELY_20530 [Polyangiaceae bacterium]